MKLEIRIWIGVSAVNEVVIDTIYQHAKEIVFEWNSKAITMNSF